MTEYGIEIRNTSNVVIIDSKFKNHVYHAHGTSFVQQYMNSIDIPPFSGSGALFVKPTDFFTKGYGFDRDEGEYVKLLIASDSTGYIDWIVFKEIDQVPPEDYGLNIFDSSGTIVFSSNETGYLNVVRSYNYSQQPLTVGDADNHYFGLIGMGLGYNLDIQWSGGTKTTTYTRRMTGMKKVDSTTLNFDTFVYNIEVVVESEAGSGGIGGVGSWSSVPQKLIEIKSIF